MLKTKVGNLLELTEEPEATQYHQSQQGWPSAPDTDTDSLLLTKATAESKHLLE